MIKARPNRAADRLFWLYLRGLLRRHFYALWLVGELPNLKQDQPVLLLPNHHSWWDGFYVYLLNRMRFHRSLYLMMLEEQLQKNQFFSQVGAYSIDPRTPGGIRASLDYTRSLLRQNALVCLFPQGELTASVDRPIHYRPGLGALVRRSDHPIQLVQLAIKPLFLQQQRPEVFMLQSPVRTVDRSHPPDLHHLQNEHDLLLDRLDRAIAGDEPKTLLLQGKQSINEKREHKYKLFREGSERG